MRKIYIFIVFLALLAALFPLSLPPAAALGVPGVQAASVLLAEAGTRQILYEDNKEAAVQPGGSAKVMTLLVAVQAIEKGTVSLDEDIVASPQALETSTTTVGLSIAAGEKMSLKDLMYCAYIASSGDACNIIAQYIAGSADAYVGMMNDEAARLGCRGTNFTNVDGATDPGHLSESLSDIRHVADAETHRAGVELAVGERQSQDVTLDEVHPELAAAGLLAGDGQHLLGEVQPDGAPVRADGAPQREREIAGATADVQR
jgi:D-alanyl-D-alanine carboxypeptidase (penicillin-binding protein 5/6)